MIRVVALLIPFIAVPLASAAMGEDGICRAVCSTGPNGLEECTFNAKVNPFAGELGYYQFEECNGEINPTIGIEVGKTYRFVQSERSNYYHPLGFAYFPDGAHAEVDELEPGIAPPGSASTCGDTMTCPAPMYFESGNYLGTYSNDESVAPLSIGEDNFGLDDYEPKFFYPIPAWTELGAFSVTLKFDYFEDFTKDIFYFCHIHEGMTGRIKILKDDKAITQLNMPEVGYEYDAPSAYDQKCGTFGLDAFQLPNPECPDRFVCDVSSSSNHLGLASFADCIDSMDCAMMAGMTTSVSSSSEVALFIHQMIPHHQNAVNMAKALLKTNILTCASLDEDTPDCTMETILREIINGQNFQIQAMRGYLAEMSYPETDDCKVEILASSSLKDSKDNGDPNGDTNTSGGSTDKGIVAGAATFFAVACLGLIYCVAKLH